METIKKESEYNIIDWFKKVVFENYANFEGRARRSEYWYYTLANVLILLSILLVGTLIIGGLEIEALSPLIGGLYILVTLALIIPSLAVAVRRLHDTGKSGWLLLIGLIPFGGIVLLVFYAQDSDINTNKWGPNPKEDLSFK